MQEDRRARQRLHRPAGRLQGAPRRHQGLDERLQAVTDWGDSDDNVGQSNQATSAAVATVHPDGHSTMPPILDAVVTASDGRLDDPGQIDEITAADEQPVLERLRGDSPGRSSRRILKLRLHCRRSPCRPAASSSLRIARGLRQPGCVGFAGCGTQSRAASERVIGLERQLRVRAEPAVSGSGRRRRSGPDAGTDGASPKYGL